MLKKIVCECGRKISFRALKRHLIKNDNKKHTKEYIKKIFDFIIFNKKHRHAWIKKEGINAISNPYWGVSVLSGETNLEDWNFKSPRPAGTIRPMVAKKMGTERTGNKNPVNKARPKYDIEKIKKTAAEVWESVQIEDLRLNEFYKIMNKKLPYFAFSLSDFVPASKSSESGIGTHKNCVISFVLGLSIEEINSIRTIDRGKRIKKAHNNPETRKKLLEILKRNRENNNLGYISKAQKKLLNMIRETLDKDALLEKHFDYKETWKSYDVYSPKYDVLFEMHGRVWHDLTKCKPNMINLVKENVENDKIKIELAKQMEKKLYIFWDDQKHFWKNQLNKIFEELQNENKKNIE